MENIENSSLEQSENITPPQAGTSFFSKLKTKWPIVLGALGSIAIFAAIIYAAYSYGKRGQEVQSVPSPTVTLTPSPTPTITTSVPTPVPSQPTKELSEIENWKIFQGTIYTIKYPSDWVLEGPYKGLTGFPEEIIIFSSGRYTALSITLGQPPYGFTGHTEFESGSTIIVRVGDVNYEVTEARCKGGENSSDTIFWDLGADEHIALGIGNSGEQEELSFHFVFGNGYPSHARSSDKLDSEERYSEDLKTVLQILSTFKFLD